MIAMILSWTRDFGYALEQLLWCNWEVLEAICVVPCTPTEPHAWDEKDMDWRWFIYPLVN